MYAKNIRTSKKKVLRCKGMPHTDCQQKNRYIQIVCHSRINRAIILKFSGHVHRLLEQLMYKIHVYISNDIYFIQLFVTYPYLMKTNHFNNFVTCVFGVDDTFQYHAIFYTNTDIDMQSLVTLC